MQHPFKAFAGILGTAVAIAGVLLIALPSRADAIMDAISVPEPATIGLVAVGVVAVAYLRNRK